jgi:hypothetical protein
MGVTAKNSPKQVSSRIICRVLYDVFQSDLALTDLETLLQEDVNVYRSMLLM